MGLRSMAQRPVCASISIDSIRKTYSIMVLVAGVVFIEGARAFKHKRSILERKVFAAIATNGDQKELSCSHGGGEGMWDSAENGTVGWHM